MVIMGFLNVSTSDGIWESHFGIVQHSVFDLDAREGVQEVLLEHTSQFLRVPSAWSIVSSRSINVIDEFGSNFGDSTH